MDSPSLDIGLLMPESTDCERCVDRLEAALLGIRGVLRARIDRRSQSLTLSFDPSITGLQAVEKEARDAGVDLARKFRHGQLSLQGLDCMDCAAKIEKGVGRVDGVVWCLVNFATSRLQVEYEAERADLSRIIDSVRNLGYDVREEDSPDRLQARKIRATVASGVLLAVAALSPPPAASFAAGLAIAAGGWQFMRNGLAALRMLSIDTNLLMGLAAVGAAALGQWREGATVVFLYSLGNVLEGAALGRNRRALEELLELVPQSATRLENGAAVRVPASQLRSGDAIRILPWERVPADVRVTAGTGEVDQSSLTGESAAVAKRPGDEVLSGSRNGGTALDAQVLRAQGRDTLSQVLKLVRTAQGRKAPSQTISETFGRVYSPIVLTASAAIALYGLATAGAAGPWLERALTLLVCACPCALVIATPVAIASALTRAARDGVLVKGGVHLEILGRCRTLALDKTGTLTTGRLTVESIVPSPHLTEEEALRIAAIAASGSDHPAARALTEHALKRAVAVPVPRHVEVTPGMGVAAQHDGRLHLLGKLSFLAERGGAPGGLGSAPVPNDRSAVWIARDGDLAGVATLGERLRPGVSEALRRLRLQGFASIVMLTGDTPASAHALAARVSLTEVRAGLLPAAKSEAVEELDRRAGPVAMVGDGVNDAPALARAAVGIALGSAGNAVAMETADIVIMGEDLGHIPDLVDLSRRTSRVIRQNVAVSVTVVLAMALLAIGGGLGLTWAVLAHEGSALLVIANGLRLLGPRGTVPRSVTT